MNLNVISWFFFVRERPEHKIGQPWAWWNHRRVINRDKMREGVHRTQAWDLERKAKRKGGKPEAVCGKQERDGNKTDTAWESASGGKSTSPHLLAPRALELPPSLQVAMSNSHPVKTIETSEPKTVDSMPGTPNAKLEEDADRSSWGAHRTNSSALSQRDSSEVTAMLEAPVWG